MAWGVPTFQDGDYSVASPIGLPEKEAPLPGIADEVILNQRFTMSRNAYDTAGALALNTPHYAYTDFVLVDVGPRKDIGGGMVEFVRTYAKVPPTRIQANEWPDTIYSFIGTTYSYGNPATFITRVRRQWKVKSQVQYDYFLVPTANAVDPITGDVYSINTPGDIEQILDMQYVIQNTINAPPGALVGGIQFATDSLNLAAAVIPTWPTSEQYRAMIQDAISNGWNATKSQVVLFPTDTLAGNPTNSGHMAGTIDTNNSVLGGIIPAEPSSLTRWKGNIYQRATKYVLVR